MMDLSFLSFRGSRNLTQIWPRIADAVHERERMGRDPDSSATIDLSTAENQLIRDDVKQIITGWVQDHFVDGVLSYPAGLGGDLAVIDALVSFINEADRSNFRPLVPVQAHHIATAPGASACIDALMFNICDPGDAVLLPAPYWSAFEILLRLRLNITIIPVQTDTLDNCFSRRLLDVLEEALEGSWTPVKALLFTNPHNPLAQCYPRWLIEEVMKFCSRRRIHFISDEIYSHSLFGCCVGDEKGAKQATEDFVSALSLDLDALQIEKSLVHVVWSMSKDFGSNGIRFVSVCRPIFS